VNTAVSTAIKSRQKAVWDLTNNVRYSNLEQASIAAGLNKHELATYIHFGWKRKGSVWKYAVTEPVTGLILEN
jgi:hypothetical protein